MFDAGGEGGAIGDDKARKRPRNPVEEGCKVVDIEEIDNKVHQHKREVAAHSGDESAEGEAQPGDGVCVRACSESRDTQSEEKADKEAKGGDLGDVGIRNY